MKIGFFPCLLLALSLVSSLSTQALAKAAPEQPKAAPQPEVPLEITAEKSLEWDQTLSLYIAKGNAKATKGETVIESDKLLAHQAPKPKTPADQTKPLEKQATAPEAQATAPQAQATTPQEGQAPSTETHTAAAPDLSGPSGGDIDWIKAEGHVHIFDPTQQIFGDRAVYNTTTRKARVTGTKLKYQTAYEVVTARDALEYDENANTAKAIGKAIAVHQKTPQDRRVIEGDVLTAYFSITPEGKKELTQIKADGNVTVVTASDISRGDHGTYDVKQNKAIMTGRVKVTHGTSQIYGDTGETDFMSGQGNISRTPPARVHALWASDKKSATEDTTAPAPEGAVP